MPKPPVKLYHSLHDGKYQVFPGKTGKKKWSISIPAYVYDLWMPLLGAEAIGVYGAYVRLGYQNDGIYGRDMHQWAAVFRMGTRKLALINAALEECGFIRIERPSGTEKRKHFTTKIIVLHPPREVSPELIRKYVVNGDPERYQLLTPWFLKEEGKAQPEGQSGINFQMEIDSETNFQMEIGSRENQFPNGYANNQITIYNQTPIEEQSRNRGRASTPAMSGGAAARPEEQPGKGKATPYLNIPALQADLHNDRSGEQRVVETPKGYQPEAGQEEYTAFERWMLAQCPRTRSLSEKQRANFNRRVWYAPEKGADPVESMTVNEAWDKSEDYRRFVKECILLDIQARNLLHPTGFDRFLNSPHTWQRFVAWKEAHGEEIEQPVQQQEQPEVDYDTWTDEQLAELWRSQGYGEDTIKEYLEMREWHRNEQQ